MVRALLLTPVLILAGCSSERHGTSPERYLSSWDRFVARSGLEGVLGYPCARKETDDHGTVLTRIPDDQCYRFNAPERVEGVWIDEFEGQRLLSQAQFDAGIRRVEGDETWLEVEWADYPPRPENDVEGAPRTFRIVFIGRRSTYPGAYGHLGGSRHLVLVDRIISLEEIKGK